MREGAVKTCRPGGGRRALALGCLCGFGLPAALLLLAAAAFGGLSGPLRLALLCLGLLLASLLGLLVYRVLYLGPPYVVYGREAIEFHFSRHESLPCTYDELKRLAEGLEEVPSGYVLRLRCGTEIRDFPLSTAAANGDDLVRVLREKGVFQHFGVT